MIDEFSSHGVGLISVSQGIDTSANNAMAKMQTSAAVILAPKTPVFSPPLRLSDPLWQIRLIFGGGFWFTLAEHHRTSRRGEPLSNNAARGMAR